MTTEKTDRGATKEYVVVFDQMGVATGETLTAPGMHPVALTTEHVRGDTVKLTEDEAKRHLESGAVIAANDPRAKGIKPNELLAVGVKRDPVLSAVQLDEQATPTLDELGKGAKSRRGGTSLGTKADLERLKVGELKALAAEHGVEVEGKDTKKTLAAKLSKVKVDRVAGGQTENPGQGKDQSAPPEVQPDE